MFGEGRERTLLVLAHLNLIVVPLVSLLAAANSTYARRTYTEFLLTQPVSRAAVFLSSVTALVVGLAGSFVVPVGLVSLPAGLPTWDAFRVLAGGAALAVTCVLAGVLVATLVDDRTRGLGAILVVWFVASVVYDAMLLYVIVLFEEYPVEPVLAVAVLVNPVDAVRLLMYQNLGLRFLLPVALPEWAIWGSFVAWAGVLLVVGWRAFVRKDY
jgi:Cu-processing system permease protein